MLTKRFVGWIFSVAMMVLGACVTSAQDYPSKPVRIVTSPVGGGGDFIARLIGEGIAGSLGQPVIVDNRPTNLGPEVVLRSAPDGYTLLIGGGAFMVGPLVTKAPYDTERDFLPISLLTRQPNLLAVHPSLPVKSVKELIALAKARPGELNFASGSIGGGNHRAGAMFAYLAGVKIVLVPYNGSAQSIIDLLSGVVHLTFDSGALLMPHVKLGRLRALAVTSAQPSPLFPGLPAVAAALPGYESSGRLGIWAPGKTPAAAITRLNQEIVRVLNKADVKEKLLNSGVEAVSSSPEELAAIVKSELAVMAKIIKDAGVKVE